MNKLWNKIIRLLLIVFAICLALGGGMVLAAAALGGTLEDASVNIGSSIFRHLNNRGIQFDDWDVEFDDEDDDDDDEDEEDDEDVASAESADVLMVDANDIRVLDAELKTCDLKVEISDKQEISVRTVGDTQKKIVIRQDGNTIDIIDKRKSIKRPNNYKIVLTVPKDYKFEKVDVEMGAGTMEIDRLEADELEIQSGAGEMSIMELIVHRNLDAQLGAGNMEVREATIGDTDIKSGAGEVAVEKCTLTGNLDIATGVGEIKLNLTGDETDYNYDLNCGMGEVKLFNKSYSSLGKEIEIDNNAAYTISLKGGMGGVIINKAK